MTEIPNLTDDQWMEILERLTYHAVRKFQKFGWQRRDRRKFEWAGPNGASPQDIALEAITSVLEETRKYDATANPDLLKFLRSVVDSKISHLAEKAGRRKTGRMPVTLDNETGDFVEAEIPGHDPDPADVCMNQEVIELVKTVVEAEAEEDILVSQIFECLEAGITKPAEMAEILEVNIQDVYNAQKRLRRKIHRAFSVEKER